MRLMVLVAVHQRPEITRVFYAGMNRLHAELKESGVDMKLSVVYSDLNDWKLSKKELSVHIPCVYTRDENTPLGRKHNSGFTSAMRQEWDAAMIMGSDDLIATAGVVKLCESVELLGYCGFESLFFHNIYSKEFREFRYKGDRLIGCGRMISREACDTLRYGSSYKLWSDNLNRSLDKSSSEILLQKGFLQNVVDFPTCMLDIKSSNNITNYQNILFLSKEVEEEQATWFLSEREVELLRVLG